MNQKAKHRRTKKKLAAACALLALSATLALPAGALSPTYRNMTSAYRQSRYYLNLETLTLRGDGATDLVMVAMSQLGYHEGNNVWQCHGENRSFGSANYVEYNYYHGKIDQNGNGRLTYSYPWCASFVSWCARMAGIDQDVLPDSLNCAAWVRQFRQRGEFHPASAIYIPQQGDLIFFRAAGSTALATHVGIVRYECNGLVYTIEGNRGNAVQLAAYDLTNTTIVGYATPDYRENASTAIDYLLDAYTKGNYIIAAETLPVRQRPNGGRVTYTLHRGDLMHIYECRDGWGRTDYGWIPMTDTQPIDVT